MRLPWVAAYRMGVLLCVFILARFHWERVYRESDPGLQLTQVRTLFPDAALLQPDPDRPGCFRIENREREFLGWATETSPDSDEIVGYAGPSNSILVFDPRDLLVGGLLSWSRDTQNHARDVREDSTFWSQWANHSLAELAGKAGAERPFDGVSGATRTSTAVGKGILARVSALHGTHVSKPGLQWKLADTVNSLALAGGLIFCFLNFPGKKSLRRVFQVLVLLGVGILYGDLLALSLLDGWARSGVPWLATPGVCLMAAGALAVPWMTRRPLYCGQICPFGILQEWLGRWVPAKYKWPPPAGIQQGLRQLPSALLFVALVVVFLGVPLNLAGLEPFDAFSIQTLGFASLWIAMAGLIVSAFIPMAYCRFACPTGEILRYVRMHGKADRFGRADGFAGLFLMLAIALLLWGETFRSLLLEVL